MDPNHLVPLKLTGITETYLLEDVLKSMEALEDLGLETGLG